MMVHSVYSNKDVFVRELISNAADACERLRYEAIAHPALLGDDPKLRITIAADPERREITFDGQRHRHEPRRDGRGARHHRALRHQGVHGEGRGGAGRRRRHADRPVRRRLLLGVHGGGPGRRDLPPRRQRRGLALVVGRQGHVLGHARRARRGARARHPGGPARDGGRQVLHRALDPGAHRQGAVRPRAGADRVRREAGRRAGRDFRRRRALDQAALRDHARRVHRLLPQHRRTVRRAGAHRALPRRGPARIHRAGVRAEHAAVRPVRCRPQGPHQALRQARVHHRRCRDPAALSPVRARAGRFRRPAAQRLARDDPDQPDPGGDQEERHRPRARRPREARRQRCRRLRQGLGGVRPGAEGRHLRGFRAPRRAACRWRASRPRPRAKACAA